MAKYDARLTLATVEGLTSRISLNAHQIGTRCAKAMAHPLTDSEYRNETIIKNREEAMSKLNELEVDIKALRKILALMERNML